ncbi:thiosulfate oxidation carrier protein SoxY [Paracoccus sp. S-4012]|uniref:thiosulfate oxidation carrier protein SoxY n=1 Tax=Paracoccus sp. S-4012 TaxID=2665648 RepID=UPI0012B0DF82|nr:thiosulfate oxidation carrier protein SoxY [Paracoccus sp. S-4012]MRX48949.1 thiosulfate oxidation carrier protein SoxY [Paracoccus sp. S-4012]
MILSRRTALLGLAATILPLPVWATPEEVAAEIVKLFGSTPLEDGPITIDLPALAETGNSVPMTVAVESPMTADDRITRLAVFAEQNPRPLSCEVRFGPMAAEPRLVTNIRLAATQTVVCVAEHSDGRLMAARADVRVVVGACTALPGRY